MKLRDAGHERRPPRRTAAACLALVVLASCSPPDEAPRTPTLPASLAAPVEADGASFAALAYQDPQEAETTFGFDIRGAGLLPLLLTIDNRGGSPIKLVPRQTFLVDLDGQAWPLLTAVQTFGRVDQSGALKPGPPRVPQLDGLESLTGFAVDVTLGQGFSPDAAAHARLAHRIAPKLAGKTLRNPTIPPDHTASGVLFFPGRDEARGARSLRLCYKQGGERKFLTLPLKQSDSFTAPR